MELKILGSGASTGVPIIACPCAVCHSSNPRNKRNRPSALITTDNGENILIDTSPDLRQQAIKFNITHLEGVLFTHAHADHVMGFDDLRAFNFIHPNCPTPCYAIKETIDSIKEVFAYIFIPRENYKGGLLAQVEFHEISQYEPFSICGLTIHPFKLIHSSIATTGYRIGNTAYVTDCNKIPDETLDILQGVENIIVDGLRDKPHATHFGISEAIALGQQIHAKRIVITHLSHSVEYEETSRNLPVGVELAYDGLTIPIKL